MAIIRHHFEPNYDLKEEQESLNPGYSRLRIFKSVFRDEDAIEIAEEYFKGIKEIVFVSSRDALSKIFSELEIRFIERKICPAKNDLIIADWNRERIFTGDHYYLNEYLLDKTDENPDFVRQLIMPIYKLEGLLLSFSSKLYDRSVDIKDLSIDDFGNPPASMPYFSELIEKVIIKAEKQYALQLKQSNLIDLKECMIQIHNLGEIHAHIGKLKPAQVRKVATDVLKMLLFEKDYGKKFEKYIVVCDTIEKEQLEGDSYLAEAIKQYKIHMILWRRSMLDDQVQFELVMVVNIMKGREDEQNRNRKK